MVNVYSIVDEVGAPVHRSPSGVKVNRNHETGLTRREVR